MEDMTTFESLKQDFENSFHEISEEMRQCIEICLLCHKTCEQVLPYCLEIGGPHVDRSHIQFLSNCADICRTSAHFLMWNSDLHSKTCGLCAEVCLRCADDCDSMSEDAVMLNCARICRACAESCQRMSTHH